MARCLFWERMGNPLSAPNSKPADNYLLRDGHHLNLMGHKLIYKKIKSIIDLKKK